MERRLFKVRDGDREMVNRLDQSSFSSARNTGDTALGSGNEVEKLLHLGGQRAVRLHLRNGLAQVSRSGKERAVRTTESTQVFATDTRTLQADPVESAQAIGLRDHAERRDVLARRARASQHHETPDATMLVNHCVAGEKGPLADLRMPAQQRAIGKNHVVGNATVVTSVGIGHEKAVVPDHGRATRLRAAVQRAALAEGVAIPNAQESLGSTVREILGISPEHSMIPNDILASKGRSAAQVRTRQDAATFTHPDAPFHDRERSDLDAITEVRRGIHLGTGMNPDRHSVQFLVRRPHQVRVQVLPFDHVILAQPGTEVRHLAARGAERTAWAFIPTRLSAALGTFAWLRHQESGPLFALIARSGSKYTPPRDLRSESPAAWRCGGWARNAEEESSRVRLVAVNGDLSGVRVLTLESRRKLEFRKLLERHGAEVVSAPALRELPLEKNPAALELLDRLRAGEVDGLVLLTGVGTRTLAGAMRTRCSAEELDSLWRATTLVARGPKPVAVLREMGLAARVRAPEPNTWRELLAALDAEWPVEGKVLALQEYGRSNDELIAGLRERGAEVLPVQVYRWALPEDTAPLEAGVEALLAGKIGVTAFTTAVQLDHLLEFAGERRESVLAALRARTAIASIGPTASSALIREGIRVDIEASPPKLGPFANAIAAEARTLVRN